MQIHKKSLPWGMFLLAITPVLMSVARLQIANTGAYLWMNWNLFLAFLPLLFASQYRNKHTSRLVKGLWFILWLGFLPNAPYMITDFIHLADVGPHSLLWYDAFMIFGFAWVGMLSWLISVKWMYKELNYKSFIPIVSLLTAFGVYLGRYIRFNTWDLITKPLEVINRIGDQLISPLDYDPFLLFTLIVWIFLMISYLGYRMLSHSR